MAHLLGSQNNLESLQQDVRDIHGVACDILSRVGPVRFPSWKYPDKVSCELDIDELLEIYCYSQDEDHSKLSHIILFELVIERLVLALQGLSQFCDNLLKSSGKEPRPTSSRLIGSSMSVGLVAKKFWNKLVHMQQTTQQLQLENKAKLKTLSKMESTINELRDEIKMFKQVLDKKTGKDSVVGGKVRKQSASRSSARFILSPTEDVSLRSPSPSQDLTLTVEDVAFAKTFQETATQTYDTAFIPCEACARTQQNLIEVGNAVMKVCESQGLPSSLAKQKKLLKQSLLAAADVSRWASEQNRDLARINSHLDNLYAQINPLQEKLSNSQEKCRSLEKEIRTMENKLEEEKSQMLKHEVAFSEKLNKIVHEKDKLLASAMAANEELANGKEKLQEMVEKLEADSRKHQNAIKELELNCRQLTSDLDNKTREVTQLRDVELELENLKQDLGTVQSRLKDTSLELDKSQAKNRSLIKHEQALQSKHDALLSRLDELDSECEGLRDRLEEMEGEKDDLQDALDCADSHNKELNEELKEKMELLQEIRSEKEKLEKDLGQLESNVYTLEGQLRETEDKLQLVMEYPSLDTQGGGQGTKHTDRGVMVNGREGDEEDVARDMEKQVMANNIRIMTLEQQNEMLRKSITLLAETQRNAAMKHVKEPVSLWTNPNPEKERDHQAERIGSPGPGCYVLDDDMPSNHVKKRPVSAAHVQRVTEYNPKTIYPHPPPQPRAESAKARHKSPTSKLMEKRQSASLSSKLAFSDKKALNILGSAGGSGSKGHEWEHSKGTSRDGPRSRPTTPHYNPVNMFVCSGCDKMYTSQKDLDIHKSFCYGRIS